MDRKSTNSCCMVSLLFTEFEAVRFYTGRSKKKWAADRSLDARVHVGLHVHPDVVDEVVHQCLEFCRVKVKRHLLRGRGQLRLQEPKPVHLVRVVLCRQETRRFRVLRASYGP